jgi:hypothetical protein
LDPKLWFEAEEAAKVNGLEEFFEKYSIDDISEQNNIKETLFPEIFNLLPDVSTSNEYCSGIYQHYIDFLANEFRNSEFDSGEIVKTINSNILETKERIFVRNPMIQENPEKRPGYGLVIGRIQSGKTAHLIGLIMNLIDPSINNKPVDTVIVLSGLIDDLRKQTLERVVGMTTVFKGSKPIILPNEDDLSSGSNEDLEKIRNHLTNYDSKPMIIVIKKNHLVLNALRSCIPTNEQFQNRRILIIDDEADHASMDTGNDDEDNQEHIGESVDELPSETNRQLRLIIKRFEDSDSCWYIGYTATPFANLLSAPWTSEIESTHGLSLHPRDMLHALGKPLGHWDNEQYFLLDNCSNLITMPHVNIDEEVFMFRELILRHILTKEIKKINGIIGDHSSLVHTAVEVIEHQRVALIIRDQIDYLKDIDNIQTNFQFIKKIKSNYDLQLVFEKSIFNNIDSFKDGFKIFNELLDVIEVIELNRRNRSEDEYSPQNIEYNTGQGSFIIVGGTRLSRGLTIKGLTTSFFSRRAQIPNYDTMLQMARWCGYRPKYSDLVRIITTEQIATDFINITNEEINLRRRIRNLPINSDPMEEQIWIREHPGMNLTSPEKMERAISRTWGALTKSTIWNYSSPEIGNNKGNKNKEIFKECKELIEHIVNFHTPDKMINGVENFILFRKINGGFIEKFMNKYHDLIDGSGGQELKDDLRALLRDNPWYSTWNVAIHTPVKENMRKKKISNLEIGLINRSITSYGKFGRIQTSGADPYLDLGENDSQRIRPLLIIYLINPNSTKDNKGIIRTFAEDVKLPVTAFGICLPSDNSGVGGTEWSADK